MKSQREARAEAASANSVWRGARAQSRAWTSGKGQHALWERVAHGVQMRADAVGWGSFARICEGGVEAPGAPAMLVIESENGLAHAPT